jgi:hypothetical protein
MAAQKIKPIERGSKDTLLSAKRANELFRAINAFLNVQAGPGIKITRGDRNLIIERVET